MAVAVLDDGRRDVVCSGCIGGDSAGARSRRTLEGVFVVLLLLSLQSNEQPAVDSVNYH